MVYTQVDPSPSAVYNYRALADPFTTLQYKLNTLQFSKSAVRNMFTSASVTPSGSFCFNHLNFFWLDHFDQFLIRAQAMAASPAVSSSLVVLVFVVLLSGASARLDPKHKTHNVTFYAHEAIETGDDATARIVAGPGGNVSALQLGALVVVDDTIRATADPKSSPLGKLQGLYVLDGGQKYRVQVTVIIDQPGDLVETTYEIAGQRASFNVSNDRQLAVLAGTGNFLGQKGYALVSTVSQKLVGNLGAQYNVQKWTLVVGK